MKEKLKFVVLLILIILAIISIYIIKNPRTELTNEEDTFRVNKIILYSSANGIPSGELKEYWEINIYQYTDIAIYIEKLEDKTIDNIYIDNIKIEQKPQLGEANIYKKNLKDFAKPIQFDEAEDNVKINISQSDNADFLDDCSIPIVLSYINKLEKDYIIPNNGEQLEYNETILKRAKILTSELEAQISFNINIIDKDNSKYTCSLNLNIPIEELMNETNLVEINENIEFIRKEMN